MEFGATGRELWRLATARSGRCASDRRLSAQHATRAGREDIFREYTQLVDQQSEHLATLRGLFQLKEAAQPVPLDEVAREALFADLRERVRDVREGPDGYLYLLTDSGKLIQIRD